MLVDGYEDRFLKQVVEETGDETFITPGYSAYELIIEFVSNEIYLATEELQKKLIDTNRKLNSCAMCQVRKKLEDADAFTKQRK